MSEPNHAVDPLEMKDPLVYDFLQYDLTFSALRIIARAVRAVVGGTLDMTVQVELENFANECDNRIQHHERMVTKARIAELNAQHRNPPPIVHIVVPDQDPRNGAEIQEFEDLL